MDFTREPIIETIISPREGHKLIIRNSKNASQEEHSVEAVEVVSFGQSLFFRSQDRPKPFLVPVSDYEVVEVREARMILKTPTQERSIKIGGGKETKAPREAPAVVEKEDVVEAVESSPTEERPSKKKERRRSYRKRRGRDAQDEDGEGSNPALDVEADLSPEGEPLTEGQSEALTEEGAPVALSPLLTPPPLLISETLNRYRENDQFKSAFYLSEDDLYKPHDKVDQLLNDEEEEAQKEVGEAVKAVFDTAALQQEEAARALELLNTPTEATDFPETNIEDIAKKFQDALPLYAEEQDLSMETPLHPENH